MSHSRLEGVFRNAAGGMLLFLLLALQAGCSTTRPVAGTNLEIMLEEIKRKTADDEAILEYVDGTEWKATMIHGDGDTLHFTDPDLHVEERVPTVDVRKITLVSHGRGAGQGLGLGMLVGAVLGGLAGYSLGDDPDMGGFLVFSYTAEEKAGMGAAGGALAGGLIGLVAGGSNGARTVYRFEQGEVVHSGSEVARSP